MILSPTPTLLSPRILIPFIIVTLIWGSTWIVIRDQLGNVPPTWSVSYRFGVAAIGMFALVLIRREPLILRGAAVGYAGILGVLQFALNFNLVYRAESYVTSGVVAVIFALLIIPNTLLSRIFLKTSLDRRFLAGSVVAITGIVLLLIYEAQAVRDDSWAVFIGFGLTVTAVFSVSIANVMQATRFARAQSPSTILAWAMLFGSISNALFSAITVGAPVIDMRPSYLIGVVYLGLVGTVVTFPMYFAIIRQIGAGPAAWSSVLIPIVAMGFSTLIEGYVWSPLSIGGAVFAIAGLIIALKPGGH